MKKTLLALILAVIFVLSFTLCVSATDISEIPEETEEDILLGDVDGDGNVTVKDARLALRASAQLEKLYATPFDAADVNGDGRVTASDARSILRYAARLTDGF